MNSRLGSALFALLFVSLACSLAGPANNPASQTLISPSPSPSAEILPTDTESAQPPSPPAPSAEPTAADPRCLPVGDPPDLQVEDFEAYPQAVAAFLNAGGSVEALDAALYAQGVANQPVTVAAADLTGDGKEEVLVSIFDPLSQAIVPGGKLLLYACLAGEFVLAHKWEAEEAYGAPGIRYLQDLNADSDAELVASSATCGAHTCFEETRIIDWNGSSFENRLEGVTNDLPYPDIRIEDPDGDGRFDLVVVGSGFGSVGAGPQRNLVRRWAYSSAEGGWQLVEETRAPSNYRIHVLHDAESAALEGEYEEALLLYGRVVQDTTLEEWMEPERERANLAAYARFKSAVIHYLEGRADFAQATLDELQAKHPAGETGHAYVELAAVFQDGFAEGGVAGGCAAAQEYAAQHEEEILQPLGGPTYGYANPEYEPEEICPWE